VSVTVKVGMASCGLAAGSGEVYEAAVKYLESHQGKLDLQKTACVGLCFAEPVMEVITEDGKNYTYGEVLPEEFATIMESFEKGKPQLEKLILSNVAEGSENENLATQTRIVLRNCGVIDPESIDSYLEKDGYKALEKALKQMTPEDIINEMKESGLRGRGGAGFPTGLKWMFAFQAPGPKKYIVCNADEGDPGAFMDRSVVEGNPHAVIEGMIIGAYAIGATIGYVYIRAEYPLAVDRLHKALKDAKENSRKMIQSMKRVV